MTPFLGAFFANFNDLVDCQAAAPYTYFDRCILLFIVTMLFIFLLRVLLKDYTVFICTVCMMTIYYTIEPKVCAFVHRTSSTECTSYDPHLAFIQGGIAMIPFPIVGFVYSFLYTKQTLSLVSTYLVSLLRSFSLFSFASALKSAALGTGLINVKFMRQGLLGIVQRIFIIIRNLVVIPLWKNFFEDGSTFRNIYILLKLIIQLWLLWNFAFTIRDYNNNCESCFRPVDPGRELDDCLICMEQPKDPVRIKCKHVFCSGCIHRWLADHNTCPKCRYVLREPRVIEIGDGRMPSLLPFVTI